MQEKDRSRRRRPNRKDFGADTVVPAPDHTADEHECRNVCRDTGDEHEVVAFLIRRPGNEAKTVAHGVALATSPRITAASASGATNSHRRRCQARWARVMSDWMRRSACEVTET